MVIEHHPDLEAEQAIIARAYACLDAMRRKVEGFRNLSSDQLEKQAWERWQRLRVASLTDDGSALVFGRIDGDERFYIGRRHVEDDRGDPVAIDWRAPVSAAFYRASAADPMGLRARRHFLVEGSALLGLADETFADGAVAGSEDALELLRHALERRRGGEMRDIVATIQAEQDLVIRSPLEGVVVVQGGPGTGKTSVGLHRAAYLLYEHRATLERLGVLVVGPNRIFIRYVSQVLPSLGESAIDQRPVEALGPAIPLEPGGDPEAERLKGDARMAAVLREAVWSRPAPATADVEAAIGARRVRVPAASVTTTMRDVANPAIPYHQARERFLAGVHNEMFRRYQGDVPSVMSFEEFRRAVMKDAGARKALDAVFPRLSASTLVRSVTRSTAGVKALHAFTPDEQRALLRGRRRAWSRADLALLDEAGALLDGVPETYGHAIVDEAQDLSPMELRMIARRCPSGSMTVLGDVAQATGVWAHASWDGVLAHLPRDAGQRVEELTLGYRVADAIMEVAAPILRAVAPELRPPVAVRRGGSVRFARLDDPAAGAARLAAAMAAEGDGAYAVIAPESLLEPVRAALAAAGADFGEARRDALSRPVTLIAAQDAKGLEFDGVVLVEPAAIVAEEGDAGLRRLFICVTRAMRDLVVVHASDLPDAMLTAGSPSRRSA